MNAPHVMHSLQENPLLCVLMMVQATNLSPFPSNGRYVVAVGKSCDRVALSEQIVNRLLNNFLVRSCETERREIPRLLHYFLRLFLFAGTRFGERLVDGLVTRTTHPRHEQNIEPHTSSRLKFRFEKRKNEIEKGQVFT
jgi:hypothetical protein